MSEIRRLVRLRQIVLSGAEVLGLDGDGQVWAYLHPDQTDTRNGDTVDGPGWVPLSMDRLREAE